MAIIILTGKPGTGKTLYAIQKYIIPELKKGKQVYTNIDGIIKSRIAVLFKIEYFDVENNLKYIENPQYFYKNVPKNSTIVIDEAQNIFNNRDWQSQINKDCINYAMEHRHHGHNVVLITPHPDGIDAGIRRCVQLTYKHKNFSIVGDTKQVRCAIFDEVNLVKGPLQTFTWKHDKRIYDCYRSYFEKGVREVKPKVNIFKNGKLIVIIMIIVVSSFFALKNMKKYINRFKKFDKKSQNIEEVGRGVAEKKKGIVIEINGEEIK